MNDREYMTLAIQLAKATTGQTSPNPVVGSVVVKDGQIKGMGAHLKAGEPHAEVHALTMAGDEAIGATIYVTLEPCSHHGRTPPCADLIIKKGVRRVVIATVDPNPVVAGKGIEKLQAAGIEVEVGLLKEEADQINQVFFHYMKTKRPFVTLKSASSLDGKTATVTKESKWITGNAAREDSHRYRHQHDAIMVGIGTVIEDNPSLTTRLQNGGKNPLRIILDHQLRIPLDATVVCDQQAPTWIVTSVDAPDEKEEKLESLGVKVVRLQTSEIDIPVLLDVLGEKGITSLFVEGGATLHGSFLVAGTINQVITYIAPKLIGGKDAIPSIAGEGIESMSDVVELEVQSMERIGEDIKIVSIPKGEK
ncbi:bifunctional diaminohydroxyphosphoribosylaminopyrimidine deaminase/5-amino-6-(5-phosphoribosylamino)uracil reductase RibD [Desertibacillus haloalkaliphilus]|uniref:bifunctional diaminohydroxyphosphoribosylaminopyrimidine deaminase/5-amino-6-(5-phosphoribosylamino)uracil reductase RibD n=1 Tax=Desertibacillus haloalkaliphilus TaxID=1328930 RepID=UPI001C261707|nr:bifunctional diaminohydroxyphosphoribosylaminopyrimidine deaminase/5-amino-6-(5-phosphoribosylamino)uracil reductase RibD [Desertibacillus haloalkaliphilus]MBU8907876.1 bifunctional diaminohydroxyphosphoribosylaminopyrimidine deaminase/5-amino-6-(5-phosphoribosylamino)uracil reductase RibD [Desertibacillus haloalkaliphilus]